MTYTHLYALLLMLAFQTSCGQQQTISSKEIIQAETRDTLNSRWIYNSYVYTDSMGGRLIIQNSFPKSGGNYTDPSGKKYVYAVFFTRVINETTNPLELSIDFPAALRELPSIPGISYRLFFPPDTMTFDREPLYDYGMPTKPFLDTGLSKPSALKRTFHPKEPAAFYVITISNKGVDGPIRTGFTFKDQDVVYSINKNEINCGRINLKNLMLQE